MQKTLGNSIEIKGIGLHSGKESKLIFHPAKEDSGIVFVRSDLHDCVLPALYSSVVDTRNCTCLGNEKKEVVSTIEHIMSALYIIGIDNTRIEIDGPEVPIMDGSAQDFYKQLKNVDIIEQNKNRKILKIKQNVEFFDGKEGKVVLSPSDSFYIDFTIDFPSKIVGHQQFAKSINEDVYAREIAPARTFCEKYQVDYLRSIGLIKGGSLENAVVLDGESILNEGGFRIIDECVKHKVLDCIGDMYTSGYRILGKVTAFHSGHYHNNEILKALFRNPDNYEIIEE